MSLFWHYDHLLNRSAGSMPKSVQHSSQEPETAILFLLFAFLLPLTILYIRLTHPLPLIFRLRVFPNPNGWPLLDPVACADLEKLDRPLETLVCECASILGWVFI